MSLVACSHCGELAVHADEVLPGVAPACGACLTPALDAGTCLVCLADAPIVGHAWGLGACSDCLGMYYAHLRATGNADRAEREELADRRLGLGIRRAV